jgi:hypothetical protein
MELSLWSWWIFITNVCIFFFLDKDSLCNPRWPQTCDPPASASRVLGLQAHIIMPNKTSIFITHFFQCLFLHLSQLQSHWAGHSVPLPPSHSTCLTSRSHTAPLMPLCGLAKPQKLRVQLFQMFYIYKACSYAHGYGNICSLGYFFGVHFAKENHWMSSPNQWLSTLFF